MINRYASKTLMITEYRKIGLLNWVNFLKSFSALKMRIGNPIKTTINVSPNPIGCKISILDHLILASKNTIESVYKQVDQ